MTTPAYVIQYANLEFPTSAEVAEMVLNHGLVIDFYRRGSLLGLEAGTVDGRIIVTGLDTDLRLARAVERLDP